MLRARTGTVPGENRPEVMRREPDHLGGIDVAGNDQRRVVGHVVAAVVSVEILPSHPLEIAQPADRRMTVGMSLERRRVHFHLEHLVRVVLAALELRDDHRALGLDLVGLVQAIRHPLGLDEEHPVERVTRRRLEVGGLVDPGVAVPAPAELLDDALHLLAGDIRRPLEVHVLDPVRDAREARRLVARADLVPAPDGGQRCGMQLLDEDLQPVVEEGRARGGTLTHRAIISMESRRAIARACKMKRSMADWKDTLNLPRTGFPMKANLPTAEPKAIERWDATDLYGRIRARRRGAPKFILHDGPPYANGRIHLGTALNKVLKDFIVRSRTMAGFDAPYVPGWDCHGLPIELKVDRELGPKKRQMSIGDFRRACRAYADRFVDIMRKDFKRLGVMGGWDAPYLTMSYGYQAAIVRALAKFVEQGMVYKGKKPVHWCIHCRTALAEAEVEYQSHTSPSIFVEFPFTPEAAREFAQRVPGLAGREHLSVLIWTTTPWTIPANLAIAFHPDFEYGRLRRQRDDGGRGDRAGRTRRGAGEAHVRRSRGDLHRSRFGGAALPSPALRARLGGRARDLRDARAGHWRRAHGAGTRVRRLRHGRPVRPRHLRPGRPRRALPRGRGAVRRAARVRRERRGSRRPCTTAAASGTARRSSIRTRTAGAATTRSSSSPRRSGSWRWMPRDCARRRSSR